VEEEGDVEEGERARGKVARFFSEVNETTRSTRGCCLDSGKDLKTEGRAEVRR